MTDSRQQPTREERRAFRLGVFTCAFAVALGGIVGLIVKAVFHALA